MKKLIKNPLKSFDNKPIIYIRYKTINEKKVCTYVGETINSERALRTYLSPGIKDNYEEIRILYAPQNKTIRLHWEAYLVIKLLPIYQIDEKKLLSYITTANKRKFTKQNIIVYPSPEWRNLRKDLREKYKGSLYLGGGRSLGCKIKSLPKTRYIDTRTGKMKEFKIVEYDIDSYEYNILMDIMSLYDKKNFEGHKKMTIRKLSNYIEKKYNKFFDAAQIHRIRERELEKNINHWNKI